MQWTWLVMVVVLGYAPFGRTDDSSLFAMWTEAWQDLIAFDIVPVRTSAEAAQAFAAQL